MMKAIIDDTEILYKAIKKTNPNQWKFEKNRPSSAAFKDSRGVSVDRDGGRAERDIIITLEKRFELLAIISVTALDCRDKGTLPLAKPETNNKYHAEIHRNCDIIHLTQGQARALSRIAKIVQYRN